MRLRGGSGGEEGGKIRPGGHASAVRDGEWSLSSSVMCVDAVLMSWMCYVEVGTETCRPSKRYSVVRVESGICRWVYVEHVNSYCVAITVLPSDGRETQGCRTSKG